MVESRHGPILVVAATLSLMVVWGIAYSFGAFVSAIADDLDASVGVVTGIFSMSTVILFILGWPAGFARDRIGSRPLIVVAAILLALGLGAGSRATDVLFLYPTYGLAVGLSVGLVFVPVVAEVTVAGFRRQALVIGLTVSGIGLGTAVGPLLSAVLIDLVSWRGAMLTLGVGGGILLLGLAPAFGAHGRRLPGAPRDADRPRRPPPSYWMLYAAATLFAVALYIPLVYLPAYAETIGVAPVYAASTISLLGGASIAGRFGLAAVSEHWGTRRTYLLTYVLVLLSHIVLLGSRGPISLVTATIVLGIGYGGFVALNPVLAAQVFGADRVGTLLGLLYTSSAVGGGFGPLLAGALVDAGQGFSPVILVCLVAITLAVPLLLGCYRLRPVSPPGSPGAR